MTRYREREALVAARHVLREWARLYAQLEHGSTMHVRRALEYRLPPADHVRALELIDSALTGEDV